MKIREFMEVVPKSFKRVALILPVCSLVAGMAVTIAITMKYGPHSAQAAAPFGIGVFVAVVGLIWILCLGYVHADARRRAMPPWLWTLVAALIPNLLGFLLYFACRRPIAQPCPHCGQPTAPEQRFCSWCGQPASPPLASGGLLA